MKKTLFMICLLGSVVSVGCSTDKTHFNQDTFSHDHYTQVPHIQDIQMLSRSGGNRQFTRTGADNVQGNTHNIQLYFYDAIQQEGLTIHSNVEVKHNPHTDKTYYKITDFVTSGSSINSQIDNLTSLGTQKQGREVLPSLFGFEEQTTTIVQELNTTYELSGEMYISSRKGEIRTGTWDSNTMTRNNHHTTIVQQHNTLTTIDIYEGNTVTITISNEKNNTFSIKIKKQLDTTPYLTIQGKRGKKNHRNGTLTLQTPAGDSFRKDKPLIFARTIE